MANKKILVVDDDDQIRQLLRDRLIANDYLVHEASNGPQALEFAQKESPDLILLDLKMPGLDGLSVLKQLKEFNPSITVIILTAFGTVDKAVEAMKQGAFDFIPKPCNPDHILLVVRRALERQKLESKNRFLRNQLEERFKFIYGESSKMKKVIDTLKQVAPAKSTVLLIGESGTGKHLLAHQLHNWSDRNTEQLIYINCTTLTEQLLESDLFGHEKGAFTGAIKQKKGRFELADGSSLFLDEISDLDLSIQAKLLHVLEYGEFQHVGGTDVLKTDVRLIAATNKELHEQVEQGKFREDLYYRLNVLTIHIPPLRERKEDMPQLIDFFLQKYTESIKKPKMTISSVAMNILTNYNWPGNVRELENTIERAVVLNSGQEITEDLIIGLTTKTLKDEIPVGISLDEAMNKFKKQFLSKTLKQTENNQSKAANILNIQRTYLNRLIKELNIKN